jgi:hypothetical protein
MASGVEIKEDPADCYGMTIAIKKFVEAVN